MNIPKYIEQAIFKLCDINHDGKLEKNVKKYSLTIDEVSIFNNAMASYNEEKGTIQIFGQEFNIEEYARIEEDIQKHKLKNTAQTDQFNNFPKLEKISGNVSIHNSAEQISEQINEDIFAQAIDNVLNKYMEKHKKTKNLLLKQGHNYIKSAKDWEVNPFILIGIAMNESACGTAENAIEKNNVGGLTMNGRLIEYKTVARSIDRQAKAVNFQYSKGHTTLKKFRMEGNYVDPTASQEDKKTYIKNVTNYANSIIEEYNKILNEKKSE